MESKTILEMLNKQASEQTLGIIATITIEEMSELIQVLCKMQRNLKFDETCRTTNEEIQTNLLEELADVEIMLQKLEYKLNIDNNMLIEKIKEKVERTEQIKESKEKTNEMTKEQIRKHNKLHFIVNRVKEEIKRKHMSVYGLQESSGMRVQEMNDLMNEKGLPEWSKFYELSDKLGTNVLYLFDCFGSVENPQNIDLSSGKYRSTMLRYNQLRQYFIDERKQKLTL